jgi:hypothetical protein
MIQQKEEKRERKWVDHVTNSLVIFSFLLFTRRKTKWTECQLFNGIFKLLMEQEYYFFLFFLLYAHGCANFEQIFSLMFLFLFIIVTKFSSRVVAGTVINILSLLLPRLQYRTICSFFISLYRLKKT